MTTTSVDDRLKRSVAKLIESGGRVVTTRLTPHAHQNLKQLMALSPEKTMTECINQALEELLLPGSRDCAANSDSVSTHFSRM